MAYEAALAQHRIGEEVEVALRDWARREEAEVTQVICR